MPRTSLSRDALAAAFAVAAAVALVACSSQTPESGGTVTVTATPTSSTSITDPSPTVESDLLLGLFPESSVREVALVVSDNISPRRVAVRIYENPTAERPTQPLEPIDFQTTIASLVPSCPFLTEADFGGVKYKDRDGLRDVEVWECEVSPDETIDVACFASGDAQLGRMVIAVGEYAGEREANYIIVDNCFLAGPGLTTKLDLERTLLALQAESPSVVEFLRVEFEG